MNNNNEQNVRDFPQEEMINPSDIIFDEADTDMDMPEPETANYDEQPAAEDTRLLKPTPLFMQLFNDCLGKLPYATVLKNNTGDSLKLIDLFRFVEAKADAGISIKEMNTIISFIANSPLEVVRPFMEYVENQEKQTQLWAFA